MKTALALFALLLMPATVWAGGVKIVALTPKAPANMDPSVAKGLNGLILDTLARNGAIRALGTDDIIPFLDEAGVAQLGNCDEAPSCLSELGATIGVDYVLAPAITAIGETWVFTLRLLTPSNGATAGRSAVTLPRDESALVETVCPLVQAGLDDARKQDERIEGDVHLCDSNVVPSSGFDVLPPPPPPPDEIPQTDRMRFGLRLGVGGQTGILGAGAEARYKRFSFNLGTGSYTLTAATSATLTTFSFGSVEMSPYGSLHVAWTLENGLFGIEQRPGVAAGATIGLEVMPLRWLSIRGGAGFAYNPQTWGEPGYAPLAWDGTVGFLF